MEKELENVHDFSCKRAALSAANEKTRKLNQFDTNHVCYVV